GPEPEGVGEIAEAAAGVAGDELHDRDRIRVVGGGAGKRGRLELARTRVELVADVARDADVEQVAADEAVKRASRRRDANREVPRHRRGIPPAIAFLDTGHQYLQIVQGCCVHGRELDDLWGKGTHGTRGPD